MFDAPSSQKKTFKLTLDYAKSKLEKQEKRLYPFVNTASKYLIDVLNDYSFVNSGSPLLSESVTFTLIP